MSNKKVFVAPNQNIGGALVWHTEKRKISNLLPYEENPRTISDKQMADLKKSLRQFNLVEIPAVDVDGKIIAGHQRVKGLQILGRGEEEIDVRVPNRKLTTEEYERYLLTSNAVTGDWDYEKLKIYSPDFLVDIGFDPIELGKFWDEKKEIEDDSFDEKAELAKIKEPQTKLGDLIILGGSKVLCGDSTSPEALKKLFGDEKASVIASDPPYNRSVNYAKGLGGKRDFGGYVKDDRTDKEYEEFLRKTIQAALSVANEDSHWFYFCSQVYIWLVQVLFKEMGLDNKSVCIWAKNAANIVPTIAFSRSYEPACYATKGKPYLAKHVTTLTEFMNKEVGTGNSAFDDLRDVWMVKRLPGKEMTHATSKPPALYQKAITRCSKPGDIILDSFLGSGSSLVAAEQLQRRVYGVELQPAYCDIIIKRWEKLTGKKAKVIRDEKE